MSYPHPPPPRPNEQSLCSQVKALLLSGAAPEEIRDALRAVAATANGRPPDATNSCAIDIAHFDSHVRLAGAARFAASLVDLGHELKALRGHLANGLAFAIKQRNDEAAAHLADVIRNGT